ncbi:protein Lines homolog 1-like [Branchiostoma lanceolatum]|uniref:protein Lines homolog 1-like n=1 Tax=Branchiostoma lanceolatum TaxID=7740 RepID=UPI00345456A6
MIEAMLCLLDINTAVGRYTTDCPHADVVRLLNPHRIFLQFLETTTWDHSILLDLLISMETCFLAYITRYLHLVITEWQVFQETNQLYHQTITTMDTYESSDGGIESSWKDLVIPNSNKTSFKQIGAKKCESPPPRQLDHTRGKLSQQSGAQPSDQTSEKVLDDIELEGIPALGVVTMSLSEFNRFEMDIAGQQLPAIVENVDTVQSTNPQGQDFQGQDFQGQDLQHDSKTGETCEGEKDDSFSDSSDDDKSSDNAEEESTLDKTMGVLIRLRLAVERLSEKKLFPYNVSPLLRLLTRVETRYEEE